jgi:hypothetical protein
VTLAEWNKLQVRLFEHLGVTEAVSIYRVASAIAERRHLECSEENYRELLKYVLDRREELSLVCGKV